MIAFAVPDSDLNRAVDGIAGELFAQLPEDFGEDRVALIPLNAVETRLKAICHVLTSLLASRLGSNTGNHFIGMDRSDWHRFSTYGGLLTPKQAKRYGESLACRWLITGHVADLAPFMNVNLFLWDAETGNPRYVADYQLSPSAVLAAVYTTTPAAKLQPYYLKWRSLPDMDYFALAIEVADADGDGFNELVVADEKRVKVLKWSGFNFWKHFDLPEIQYGDAETPILERTRRRILPADRDGDDLDEIYISVPPDQTWQVEWGSDKQTTIVEQQPMFLVQGREWLIVGKTTADQLTYRGRSTNCWVWRAGKIHLKHPCRLPVDYHSIATRMAEIHQSTSEIAIVDLDGHLQVYHIDKSTPRLVWQTPPIFGEGLAVGDLNGDGVPEIVGAVKDLPETIEFSDQFIILERKGSQIQLYGATK